MTDDLELLRTHPPFADMDPAALEELGRLVEHPTFADEEVVLEEGGEPADALYVVHEGTIELERDGEVLDTLGPGESFGFPSLLSGDRPAFDARAKGPTTCLRIDRRSAERVLGSGAGLQFLAVGLRDRARLAERHDPAGVLHELEEAATLGELTRAAARSRAAMADLRDDGFDAGSVGRATARVVDTATRHALDLAIAELGSPNTAWAWLVFGSVARREPGLAPDQDHTVVWEAGEAADDYFASLATMVTDALAVAGFEPCPSGVLATSSGWRGPVGDWIDGLLAPRAIPAQKAFLLTLALDLRKVAGPLHIDSVLGRLADGVRGSVLQWRVARLAVEFRPPIGALGGLLTDRRSDGTRVVDLKRGGLLAVTDLARLAAIRAGISSLATRERLHDAADAGSLDADEAQALEEAFDTFAELRLDRQINSIRRGEPVDSLVDPSTLDPVSRIRLRQSFRVVEHVQEHVRADVSGGRFR